MNSRIKSWLSSQHIIVPDEWLTACLDWISNENHTAILGADRLNQLIYEQWLISDIKNIPSCCLPAGISSMQKQKLNGHFCLQIESLMDVGSAAYSQLQKVKGTENVNLSITLKESEQHNWEPKPTRMLILQLTDGVQILQGMEYQPIPNLNINTLPGTKVLIYGNIDCRLGMLLLTNNNITVLGGHVESLMETNSQLKLLTKIVYGNNDELFSNNTTEHVNSTVNPNEPSISAAIQTSLSLGIDSNTLNNGSYFRVPHNQRIQTSLPSTSSNELPLSCKNNLKPELRQSSTINNVYSSNKLMNYSSEASPGFSNEIDFNEMINDDDDDVFANLNFDEIEDLGNRYEDQINTKEDDWQDDIVSNYKMQNTNKTIPCNSLYNDLKSIPKISTSSRNKDHFLNQSDQNFCSALEVSKAKVFAPESTYANHQKTATLNQLCNDNNFAMREVSCLSKSLTTSQNVSNNSVFISKRRKVEPSELVYSDPLSYLSCYNNINLVDKIIFVKAYITTILSKLECNNGKEWSLGVKINDGSASLDVNIDNSYLQELIGFGANDVPRMKLLAQQNHEVKQYLQNGLQSCQQKLLNLCGILKIKLTPGKVPLVLTCTPETTSTFNQLLTKINCSFETNI